MVYKQAIFCHNFLFLKNSLLKIQYMIEMWIFYNVLSDLSKMCGLAKYRCDKH